MEAHNVEPLVDHYFTQESENKIATCDLLGMANPWEIPYADRC